MTASLREVLRGPKPLIGTLVTTASPEIAEVLARAHSYGLNFADYVATANDRVAIIVQIEHKDAVVNVEEIVKVKDIDCLFVGPYDLSGSMGLLGKLSDTRVVGAIEKVRATCAAAEMAFGIFSPTAEHAGSFIKAGARVVAIGTDLMHMASAGRKVLEAARQAPSR